MSEWRKIWANDVPTEGSSPKSSHQMAAEGIQFTWRWNGDTNFLDSGVIWELSIEFAFDRHSCYATGDRKWSSRESRIRAFSLLKESVHPTHPTQGFLLMDNLNSIIKTLVEDQTWLLREREILDRLSEELQNFDVFIDLGSNIGIYSIVANEFMHDAEIICVEANPKIIEDLSKTIDSARNNNNKFRVVNKAVSDERGTMKFFQCSSTGEGNIFGDKDATDILSVPSCFLDDICPKGKKIFVKMDIEAAEYRALKSAPMILQSQDVKFLIELHALGDVERKKYPIHVAGMMLLNGFKIKKMGRRWFFGSHYIFVKAPFPERSLAFLRCFPLLLCKYIVWRMFPTQAPRIQDLLRRFKR